MYKNYVLKSYEIDTFYSTGDNDNFKDGNWKWVTNKVWKYDKSTGEYLFFNFAKFSRQICLFQHIKGQASNFKIRIQYTRILGL